jgi:hypothetical protein
LSGPHLLLPLLGQAHGGVTLMAGQLELAAELVHGTNQLILLPT